MSAIDLTVVIPCLNEEGNVTSILNSVYDVLSSMDIKSEIILVDDKSEDATFLVAKEFSDKKMGNLSIRVLRRELHRRGYGAVVRHGIAHGTGRFCVFVSADGVDPIKLIPLFYQKMADGADLVQCSRYLTPGEDTTIPFKYKFYQFFYRIFLKVLLGTSIRDSTYAFKMFNRGDALSMGLSQNRFSISPEITLKTLLKGGKIEFISSGQGVRQIGKSKFNFFKESFGYIYVLMRAWLHQKKIIYWF